MANLSIPRYSIALLLATAVAAYAQSARVATAPALVAADTTGRPRVELVADSLDTPWDMKWAPDGSLWFTERVGRVSRIDVEGTGKLTRVGTVPNVLERGEGGLMGFTFHPDFPQEPWVYFAHSYNPFATAAAAARGRGGRGGARGTGRGAGRGTAAQRAEIRNRLVRMRYADGKLGDLEVLIDSIPGGPNHNGAAVAVGPDRFLYMSMGDAGKPELAQDSTSLNGKILRLTLEGKPAPGNPWANEVWSRGHRNPQGLAFHPTTGALYASEHGSGEEDEINRIERGRNYGWPKVEGVCNAPEEEEFCGTALVVQPIWVVADSGGLTAVNVYEFDAIPGWRGSLLATTLAGRSLHRLILSSDKRTVSKAERLYEGQFGRLRDVLTDRNGWVYLATSNRDGRGKPVRIDDRIIRLKR